VSTACGVFTYVTSRRLTVSCHYTHFSTGYVQSACLFYNYGIDHNKILHSDRNYQVLSVGSLHMPKLIQNGGRVTSSKIEKAQYLSNGLTDFDKIW